MNGPAGFQQRPVDILVQGQGAGVGGLRQLVDVLGKARLAEQPEKFGERRPVFDGLGPTGPGPDLPGEKRILYIGPEGLAVGECVERFAFFRGQPQGERRAVSALV